MAAVSVSASVSAVPAASISFTVDDNASNIFPSSSDFARNSSSSLFRSSIIFFTPFFASSNAFLSDSAFSFAAAISAAAAAAAAAFAAVVAVSISNFILSLNLISSSLLAVISFCKTSRCLLNSDTSFFIFCRFVMADSMSSSLPSSSALNPFIFDIISSRVFSNGPISVSFPV